MGKPSSPQRNRRIDQWIPGTEVSSLSPFESRVWWLCLLLFALVLGAFLPVMSNGFVLYDDNLYVTTNPQVRAGLSWAGLKWAWGGIVAENWHPLTLLSHMLDVQLFGLNP